MKGTFYLERNEVLNTIKDRILCEESRCSISESVRETNQITATLCDELEAELKALPAKLIEEKYSQRNLPDTLKVLRDLNEKLRKRLTAYEKAVDKTRAFVEATPGGTLIARDTILAALSIGENFKDEG